MTTFSDGTNTVTPELVTGYKAIAESLTVVHRILRRSDPDVTLRGSTPRTGSLELLFPLAADAWSAWGLFRASAVWSLTDIDIPLVDMTFVTAGDLGIVLEDETRAVWTFTIGYQEIVA